MTWSYYAAAQGITPVVNDPNMALESAADEYAEIYEFNIGGEAVASTAMRTSILRAIAGGGVATALSVEKHESNAPSNTIAANLGDHNIFFPAPISGARLHVESWNAEGGSVHWFADEGEGFIMLGSETIISENQVGVAVSTYGFHWRER